MADKPKDEAKPLRDVLFAYTPPQVSAKRLLLPQPTLSEAEAAELRASSQEAFRLFRAMGKGSKA